jgi:hypothetical protein
MASRFMSYSLAYEKIRNPKEKPGLQSGAGLIQASALAAFDDGTLYPGARKLALTYSIKSAQKNYTLNQRFA